MGIFDGWQFDPQSYGGGAQGLLAALMPQLGIPPGAAQNPGFSPPEELPRGSIHPLAGNIPFQGQTYNMPMGNQQFPVFGMPDPAALPQNAQPAEGKLPIGAGAAQPAMPQLQDEGHFAAGFDGLLQNAHTGPVGAILGGLGGLVSGRSRQNTENVTIKALVNRGLDQDTATMIARNPALLSSAMPTLMGTAGKTDDIKEFEYARQFDPTLTWEKHVARKRAAAGDYSLTPVYGTRINPETGKEETVMMQPGKNGVAIETKLPPGFKISTGMDKVDAGTHWALYDKRSGQFIGTQPKNIAEKASQQEQGEVAGKAIAAAPADIQAGQNALGLLKKIEEHPYLERGTGLSSYGNWVPGSGGYDFSNIVEQAKSGAFLQAIQQMRGMGSLSNAEGQTATAAVNRMNVATSKEAFLDALADYKKLIEQGVTRAQGRLKNPNAEVATPPAAAPTRIRINADGAIAQ